MHSLGIVQWNSTRQDHPGNPGGVSESGSISTTLHTHPILCGVPMHMKCRMPFHANSCYMHGECYMQHQ